MSLTILPAPSRTRTSAFGHDSQPPSWMAELRHILDRDNEVLALIATARGVHEPQFQDRAAPRLTGIAQEHVP